MRKSAKKKQLTVTYKRDSDGWWVASVPAVPGCHTQGRTLSQARKRIREALDLFDVPSSVELVDDVELGKLAIVFRTAVERRTEAEALAVEVAEATRKAALKLSSAGLSRRDVGELLGVSHQRVQQLIDAE